jgi:DnaK suppressor protein
MAGKTTKKSVKGGSKAVAVKKPSVNRKTAAPARTPRKSVPAPAVGKKIATPVQNTTPRKGLTKTEKDQLRLLLINLKERLAGQVTALKIDSLQREDGVNSAEDGTDAFERQFALTIASAENHDLVEIDEALQRLGDGTYGVCQECTGMIEAPRLKALPFVRKCIACQSKTESGRKSRAATLMERF